MEAIKLLRVNELMVGDWISVSDAPKQLEGIQKINNRDGMIYHDGVNGSFIDNAVPIPITPEILEKNGFLNTLSDTIYHFRKDEYSIFLSCAKNESCKNWRIDIENVISKGFIKDIFDKTDSWSCSNEINMYINYVHELQHALKLCGIKKEIKL